MSAWSKTAAAVALAWLPGSAPDESVALDWQGTIYRLGAPIPVKVSTAEEERSKTLAASGVVFIGSDGRERRLRSSATESKVVAGGGRFTIDVDAGELSDLPPPGQFQITYDISEGVRAKPLVGKLVAPLANPMEKLEKEPGKLAVLLETDAGPILLALRPDKAPITCKNFVKLVSDGFYDGTTFHRIVRGFVVQGGAHKPDGTIKTSAAIKAEFNDLGHERGAISMARKEKDPNSATCEFFICSANHRDALDGRYAVFGKVIDGIAAVDRLSLTPVERALDDERSKPVKEPVILKATAVEKP